MPHNDDIKPSAELPSPCAGRPVLSLMPSHCHPSTCASLSEHILASSLCPGRSVIYRRRKKNGIYHCLRWQLPSLTRHTHTHTHTLTSTHWHTNTDTHNWGKWGLSIGKHSSCLRTIGLETRLSGAFQTMSQCKLEVITTLSLFYIISSIVCQRFCSLTEELSTVTKSTLLASLKTLKWTEHNSAHYKYEFYCYIF